MLAEALVEGVKVQKRGFEGELLKKIIQRICSSFDASFWALL